MHSYLIAFPIFKGSKGFSHQTILVKAKSENDAISQAMYLRPGDNVGDIKQVKY